MGRCESEGITDYTLGKEYVFLQKTSSKGTQEKYYKDNYWYKIDRCGNEGMAEFLASVVLDCSNVKDYVVYERCRINGKTGCRSRNFLQHGEEFLTFQNLYSVYQGGSLMNRIAGFQDVKQRLDYVIDFVQKVTNLDVSEYVSQILSLDMLTLNEDRHFHNLGIIKTPSGYRPAPIFDNGYSLLCDYNRYYPFLTMDELVEKIDKATAYPFSGSFEMQALAAGFHMKIDYEKAFAILDEVVDSREKRILLHQMRRYEKIFF